MFAWLWIVFVLRSNNLCFADHYKGGSLSWKPTNPSSLTSPIEVIITQRQSWTLSRYQCDETTINTLASFNDTLSSTSPTLTCISSAAACTSSLYQTIVTDLYCTDFSTSFQVSTGSNYTKENLAVNSIIDITARGASWANEILTNSWSMVAHIDLTPVSGKINTSPVTGSLPVFQLYVNELSVIQIIVYDWDDDHTVRCRWSQQSPLDECGNICSDLPSASLSSIDCAITWLPVLRSEDIANGLTESTYVAAITAEDFVNASSTIALSSVPHQVLVQVSTRPSGVCSNRPSISGFPRRNLACYAVSVGSGTPFRFQSTVSCLNDTIVEFISTSPLFVQRSVVYQISNYTWGINITWVPTTDQTGLQPFCVASVDNNGQTSSQYCIMIAVGTVNPVLPAPRFVQGTASPVGTVMSTQLRFSIQATQPLRRTTLNQTYISIYRVGGSLVRRIDCKYSTDVYIFNSTLIFFVPNPPWVLGATYYITLTDGVATADYYCGPEATGFGSTTAWRFTIWNPSLSSTTTTPSTTTPSLTVYTVATRGSSTTSVNTLLTTTGIPAYTTRTTTTTTSTTSTSSTSTTTTTATTTTTTTTTTTAYIPSVDVLYPKDFENQCSTTVALGTIIINLIGVILHSCGMTALFVKVNTNFNNNILRIRNERRMRLQALANATDEDDDEEIYELEDFDDDDDSDEDENEDDDDDNNEEEEEEEDDDSDENDDDDDDDEETSV
ncbi:unnamed protein product [Adineta ricciae]|uniref:Uncharacterized protein n=1 Tax=Adineta ricciae TaxID=249248 RepID=A0A813WRQ9_ADIRI|nr:unnamed protein product [Adineta ricciae]CAF1306101.1 unnamed protein product [Adineta ricciae]